MEKENRAIGEMLLQQMQELLYGTPPYAPMEDAPGIYLETENDGTLTIILREKQAEKHGCGVGLPRRSWWLFLTWTSLLFKKR